MITNRESKWLAAALLGLGLGLSGCGNGGSAVETRDRAGEQAEAAQTVATGVSADVDGAVTEKAKPALTANRRETIDVKITRLFERNGADFGAATPQDYLARIQAFTSRPPAGTDRVERPNGDVLLYQASTNTFAVVSGDGVPKTMFKPRNGVTYWAEQKAAAPNFGRRRSDSSGE